MSVILCKLQLTGLKLIYCIQTLSNFVTDMKRVPAALWTEFIGNAVVDNRPQVGMFQAWKVGHKENS
jgi:hypothetical protein